MFICKKSHTKLYRNGAKKNKVINKKMNANPFLTGVSQGLKGAKNTRQKPQKKNTKDLASAESLFVNYFSVKKILDNSKKYFLSIFIFKYSSTSFLFTTTILS